MRASQVIKMPVTVSYERRRSEHENYDFDLSTTHMLCYVPGGPLWCENHEPAFVKRQLILLELGDEECCGCIKRFRNLVFGTKKGVKTPLTGEQPKRFKAHRKWLKRTRSPWPDQATQLRWHWDAVAEWKAVGQDYKHEYLFVACEMLKRRGHEVMLGRQSAVFYISLRGVQHKSRVSVLMAGGNGNSVETWWTAYTPCKRGCTSYGHAHPEALVKIRKPEDVCRLAFEIESVALAILLGIEDPE